MTDWKVGSCNYGVTMHAADRPGKKGVEAPRPPPVQINDDGLTNLEADAEAEERVARSVPHERVPELRGA